MEFWQLVRVPEGYALMPYIRVYEKSGLIEINRYSDSPSDSGGSSPV